MYLVTIQSKKQGEFEPIQFTCSDDTLKECISDELKSNPNVVVIVAYVKEY